VLSPFLAIGMVIAAIGLFFQRGEDPRVRLLLTQYVPLQAIFLFFGMNKAGEPNWIAPSLVTGIVLLVVFWQELWQHVPRWRPMVRLGLGVAVVMTIALHLMTFLSLPPKLNPLKRAEGWPDVTTHVEKARQLYQPDVLTANHYWYASGLQFYLPGQPVTYLPPEPYGASQFSLWPTYQPRPGMKVLYVREGIGEPQKALKAQFRNVKLVDEFWSHHNGQQIYQFQIYLLDNDDSTSLGGAVTGAPF